MSDNQTLLLHKDIEALYTKGETALAMQAANDRMHDYIADCAKVDFTIKSEQFMLRVLYEEALALYSEAKWYEAAEKFALLAACCDTLIFHDAMRMHLLYVLAKKPLDDLVLMHKGETSEFFMHAFGDTPLLDEYKTRLDDAIARYSILFEG